MSESVVCILILDEKALLIQRRDIPVWVLPGGGIDPGETPEHAAVREMEEETGLQVEIVRKIAEYTPINRLARFTHFFEVRKVGGKLSTGSETYDVKFFHQTCLPKRLPEFQKEWIRDAFLYAPDVLQKKLTYITYWKLFTTLLRHPLTVIRYLLTKLGLHFNRQEKNP
jgi:8-oxo-dGTP pyrophosphatase MutT (NUDIX family)